MKTTKQTTIADFIAQHGLSMSCQRTSSNPNMADSKDMDHWVCTLVNGEDTMRLVFSMGRGHKGAKPSLDEVLNCLALEAMGVCETFEDWCNEYGYDTGSRKAEKTYDTICLQDHQLRRFLGEVAYTELLGAELL